MQWGLSSNLCGSFYLQYPFPHTDIFKYGKASTYTIYGYCCRILQHFSNEDFESIFKSDVRNISNDLDSVIFALLLTNPSGKGNNIIQFKSFRILNPNNSFRKNCNRGSCLEAATKIEAKSKIEKVSKTRQSHKEKTDNCSTLKIKPPV